MFAVVMDGQVVCSLLLDHLGLLGLAVHASSMRRVAAAALSIGGSPPHPMMDLVVGRMTGKLAVDHGWALKRRQTAMCLACSFPTANGHWSDAGVNDTAGMLATDRTVELLRCLLATRSLSIRRATPRAGFVVATSAGRTAYAASIDDVWPVARRLTGHSVDPLLFDLEPSNGAGL